MARVLLVEDEDTLRESVARYLELEGHSVLTAANGREAFEVGVSGRPDVLVADWMLHNHIHGLHVAQTLRVVDPSLNTVLITGFPSRKLKQEFDHCSEHYKGNTNALRSIENFSNSAFHNRPQSENTNQDMIQNEEDIHRLIMK